MRALAERKVKPKDIAYEVGCARQSVYSWLAKIAAADGDCEEALRVTQSKSRRPFAVEFTDQELSVARWCRLTKESVDYAVRFFIGWRGVDQETGKPAVRRETAEKLQGYLDRAEAANERPNWPLSVRRAFHVTDEEMAAYRGPKASQQAEMITRRGMDWKDADGNFHRILPGQLWELDDYSTNQPYWYECPESGEITANRQVLAGRDVASLRWLGFDHIGRARDAYRGEDVARFIERLMRAHGVPMFLRLERGVWESSSVHGLKISDDERWGGLDDLVHIDHTWKSKVKGVIEGGFNVLQRALSGCGVDIGRFRGEMEDAAKRLRQSKNVALDARKLGFLSMSESAEKHAVATNFLNGTQSYREHRNERVAPDDLVAREGWHTRPLKEEEAWYFYPIKKRGQVSHSTVQVNPGNGEPVLYFAVNGVKEGLHLESGYKVLVACDPTRPELGARIVNNETGAKNRQHYGRHEVLLSHAPLAEHVAQLNFSQELCPSIARRQKATKAVRTAFKAMKAQGEAVHESTASDGKGRSARAGNIEREEAETMTPTKTEKPAPATASSRFSRFATPEARAAEIARLSEEISETH